MKPASIALALLALGWPALPAGSADLKFLVDEKDEKVKDEKVSGTFSQP
jgi:hypothetical protein